MVTVVLEAMVDLVVVVPLDLATEVAFAEAIHSF